MENTKFTDLKGYEGIYKISPCGRILSIARRGANEKFLTPSLNSRGYYTVSLTRDNKRKSYLLHRLIALAFIKNPDNKQEVNHIDGNRANYAIENLEWVTPSENIKHAYRTGLKKIENISGENNSFSKLSNYQVSEIRVKYSPFKYTAKKLAEEYNVDLSCIWRILKNKSYKI